ncbi:MAG: tetratricopeptide repeat protein [Croceibacterium sp.]
MASSKDLTPPEDKFATRQAAEQDVLLREVDEAVRQDELHTFLQRYGVMLGVGFVLAMAALGGALWWKENREAKLEQRSETLVTAYDSLGAGKIDAATASLTPLVGEGGRAASAASRLTLAAIALRQNRLADAYKQYDAVAADTRAPKPYRDLAAIRLVAAKFEQMAPAEVISRLAPLAKPGSPWFGSAGELVAMAYLKQNRNDLAGPMLAAIAKDEAVPQSIRSRTRQLSGLLGFDAVDDVDKTLVQLRDEQSGAARAPAP